MCTALAHSLGRGDPAPAPLGPQDRSTVALLLHGRLLLRHGPGNTGDQHPRSETLSPGTAALSPPIHPPGPIWQPHRDGVPSAFLPEIPMQPPVRRRWRAVSNLTQCARKRERCRSCTQGPRSPGPRELAGLSSVHPWTASNDASLSPHELFIPRVSQKAPFPALDTKRIWRALENGAVGPTLRKSARPHVDTNPESWCQRCCAGRGSPAL